MFTLTALLLLCLVLVGLYVRMSRRRRRFALPPLISTSSPTLPSLIELETLTQEYGPVLSFIKGSDTTIVIGRRQAALDIMRNESALLADRPRSIAAEMLSGGMRILLMSSGTRFKLLRKALHTHLSARAVTAYQPLQTRHAHDMIMAILQNPANHQDHARRYAMSVILSMTYGKTKSTTQTDPEVAKISVCLTRIGKAFGVYKVDRFPWLRYIPWYAPELRQWHQEELDLFRSQIQSVRTMMEKLGPDTPPSFAKYLLEQQDGSGLNDDEVAYLAGSMFGAGSSTTASAISFIIMAAACFPHEQAKVQAEIDAVVGSYRAPTFEDKDLLKTVTAFVLESYRWRPVGGSGFAHRASADVFWNGYCIPKGSSVIGNHWSINQDPEYFSDPKAFRTSRWMEKDGNIKDEPTSLNFGFGRRICPGEHLANNSLFINTALLLWAFKISQDPSSPIDTESFVETGVGVIPRPFKAIFEPRHPNLPQLLESSLA